MAGAKSMSMATLATIDAKSMPRSFIAFINGGSLTFKQTYSKSSLGTTLEVIQKRRERREWGPTYPFNIFRLEQESL